MLISRDKDMGGRWRMKKHYRKILIGVVLVAVLVLAGVIYYQKSADANESFSLKMNEKSENLSE